MLLMRCARASSKEIREKVGIKLRSAQPGRLVTPPDGTSGRSGPITGIGDEMFLRCTEAARDFAGVNELVEESEVKVDLPDLARESAVDDSVTVTLESLCRSGKIDMERTDAGEGSA
jgi:hypothetical protein